MDIKKSCECLGWAMTGETFFGDHHHSNCEKFETEKNPYLFYFDDGVDAWVPASENIENVVDVANFENGEVVEIRFRRFDMTDKEFHEIPDL